MTRAEYARFVVAELDTVCKRLGVRVSGTYDAGTCQVAFPGEEHEPLGFGMSPDVYNPSDGEAPKPPGS